MSELDRRIVAAFDAQGRRLRRAMAIRVLAALAALVVATLVGHWAAWVGFGLIVITQGPVAALIPWLSRTNRRFRARLAAEPVALVWVHATPDRRAGRHRVELHLRDNDWVYLYVDQAQADGVVAAVRECVPSATITLDDAGFAEASPRHRLAGKLVRAEVAMRATIAPGLKRKEEAGLRMIATWRDRLFPPAADPYRGTRVDDAPMRASPQWSPPLVSDLEARLDKLLVSYAAAAASDGVRKKLEALVEEKDLPPGMVRTEMFTDDIAAQIAALQALADRATQ